MLDSESDSTHWGRPLWSVSRKVRPPASDSVSSLEPDLSNQDALVGLLCCVPHPHQGTGLSLTGKA